MAKEKKVKENKDRSEKTRDLFHYLKIVIAVLMVVFIAISSYFGFRLGRMIFTDDAKTTLRTDHISYELVVTKGESVLAIGRDLEEHGIIESGLAFFLQSKIYKCRIAPGTYTVNSRDSSKAIIKELNNAYVRQQQEKK